MKANITVKTIKKVEAFLGKEKKAISAWGIHTKTGWRWLSIKAALDFLVEQGKVETTPTNNTIYYKAVK